MSEMTATRMGSRAARNLSGARRGLGGGGVLPLGRPRTCRTGSTSSGLKRGDFFSARPAPPGPSLREVLLADCSSARSSRRSSSSCCTRGAAPASRASRRPARSAPGCCSRCSASRSSGSSRCRSRCSRSGGSAATTSPHESYWDGDLRRLARARRRVRLPLPRGPDRDGPGEARYRGLVAPGRSRVRRRSQIALPLCQPVRDSGYAPAAGSAAEGGRSPDRRQGRRRRGSRSASSGRRRPNDPNAFATGLGPSRKVFIWDSMLDGRFTEPQLEVVIAHEYGHQAATTAEGDRLVRALRDSRRLPDRARDAAPRRDAAAGGGPARAARLRRLRHCWRCRSRRRSPGTWRRRRTGWRCRRRATRRRCQSCSSDFSTTGLSDPEPADVGLPGLRRPPDADAANRDG